MDTLFSFEVGQLRLVLSISILACLILCEWYIPWRKRETPRSERWLQNLSLTVFNSLLAKFTLGFVPLAVSYYCINNNFGLLQWLNMPSAFHIILSYVLLDLCIYLQHIWFHYNPVLWRLHKVHHSDPDLDVTSGFRFHPVEILLSLVLKSMIILLLGAHPTGVVIFEILLNAGSLFNHSNINIKENFDRILKKMLVTPSFHLVHHSTIPQQTNSNFGFTISIWDYLFKTYKVKGAAQSLKIGLDEYPKPKDLTVPRLLTMPFEKK